MDFISGEGKMITLIPRDGYLGENVFFGQKEEAAEFQVDIHPPPPPSSVATATCLVVLIKVEYKAAIEGVILGLVGNHTIMLHNEAMT